MKKRNFFAFALSAFAAMSMLSCSQDQETDPNNLNNVVEGEQTYASFNLKITAGDAETKATGDTENGIKEENEVSNYVLIICKGATPNNPTIEAIKVGTITGTNTTIPTEAFPITSGQKTVYAFLNVRGTVQEQLKALPLGARISAIDALLVDLGTPSRIEVKQKKESAQTGTMNGLYLIGITEPNSSAGNAPILEGGLLMSGINPNATIEAGVTKEVAEAGTKNRVKINVYRNMAKITVSAKTGAEKIMENTTQVGTLSKLEYSIRNISSKFNLSPSAAPTAHPAYAMATATDFKTMYQTTATEWPMTSYHYLTENMFANGYKGNVSYIQIVADYTPTNIAISLKETDGINSASYNSEAGVAGMNILAVLTNGKPDKLLKIDAGAFADVQAAVTASAVYSISNRLTNNTIKIADIKYNETGAKTDGWYVTYTDSKTVTTPPDPAKWANTVAVEYYENSLKIDSKSFEYYVAEYKEGKTYYRMNINNDGMDGERTAVQNFWIKRNRFYKVTVNSFTGLGFTEPGDLIVDPLDPITQNTFIQAEVEVQPWTVVEYGEDAGM